MPTQVPYTYRRADGTYYARFVIPSAIRQAFPELPRECRFSLRCRSKFEADQTVVDYRQQFHRKIRMLADNRQQGASGTREAIAWLRKPGLQTSGRNQLMQHQIEVQPQNNPSVRDAQPVPPQALSEICLPNGIVIRVSHDDQQREQRDVIRYLEQYHRITTGGNGNDAGGGQGIIPKTVQEVTEAYIRYYRGESPALERTLNERDKRVRRAMGLLPQNKLFCELTYQDIEALRPAIRQLTDSRIKAQRGTPKKTISLSTAREHFSLVAEVCQYAKRIGAHSLDIAYKISMRASKNGPDAAASRAREDFSKADLNKLFNGYPYQLTPRPRREQLFPYHFWGCLLLAFTGARSNELWQLRVCDVIQDPETQIWYFDINDKGERQRLKNPQSRRRIPIHNTLISLGFLEFLQTRKKQAKPTDQLFEGLTYNTSNGWAKKFGDWFLGNDKRKSYRDEVGVAEPERKVVHSFRHTATTSLRQHEVQSMDIDKLLGHYVDKTQGRYGQFPLEPLQRAINRIDYGIDLNHMDWQAFQAYMKQGGKAPSPR